MIFDCYFNNFAFRVVDAYSCQTRRLILVDSGTVTGVQGNHLNDYSNEDVLGLIVDHDRSVRRIPRGIENFFSNLEMLRWLNGSLSVITADDLAPFKLLRLLILGSNHIISLDDNLLKHNPKLEFVGFNDVGLEHAGYDLLTDLKSLTYAYFRNNTCIDWQANGTAEVLILRNLLMLQCPPKQCAAECVDKIDFFREKAQSMNEDLQVRVLQLRQMNAKRKAKINKLNSKVSEQGVTITKLDQLLWKCMDTTCKPPRVFGLKSAVDNAPLENCQCKSEQEKY